MGAPTPTLGVPCAPSLERHIPQGNIGLHDSERNKRGSATLVAREFILRNPTISNEAAVKATGLSERIISKARKELRSLGFAHPLPSDHRSNDTPSIEEPTRLPADPDKLATQGMAQLMEMVDEETKRQDATELEPPEMRKILARIARAPNSPPQVRIAAVTAKTKLDAETADRHSLGPGPPLTREDAIVRLALLLEACGPDIAAEAMERAFSIKEADVSVDAVSPIPSTQESAPPAGRPFEGAPA